MIYLGDLKAISDTQNLIGLTAYNIDSSGKNKSGYQYDLNSGALVDSIPEPTPPDGQVVKDMLYDSSTKSIVYTYAVAVKTPDIQESILQLQQVTNTQPIDTSTLDGAKKSKLRELSTACQNTIYTGTDIEDSQGTEHFSLTTADQINISNLIAAIKAGATSVAYHADGKLCRMFTADEITNIYTKVVSFIAYHTTLYNHLKAWIDRSTTEEEIVAIEYTSTLPDDLKANMDQIIAAMTAASTPA